jgi:hypothetical protein
MLGSYVGVRRKASPASTPPAQRVRDGEGFILRLREIAGRSGEAEIRDTVLKICEAQLCNGVEVPQGKLPVKEHSVMAPYKPNQYLTLRLQAESDLKKPGASAARR